MAMGHGPWEWCIDGMRLTYSINLVSSVGRKFVVKRFVVCVSMSLELDVDVDSSPEAEAKLPRATV